MTYDRVRPFKMTSLSYATIVREAQQMFGTNVNDEWSMFLQTHKKDKPSLSAVMDIQPVAAPKNVSQAPAPTPLKISTKTKMAYLSCAIPLDIFWNIRIIPYGNPVQGVVKKQIKMVCETPDELNVLMARLSAERYVDQHIIKHVENDAITNRVAFLDVRKINIGVDHKLIQSPYKRKHKQAVNNSFVLIVRIKLSDTDVFREMHVKVFNTGKIEIPGVKCDTMFDRALELVINILQPHVSAPLVLKQDSTTILINSDFNCGYYLNRNAVCQILKTKYNIDALYDPCTYPGVRCKYELNIDSYLKTDNILNLTTKAKNRSNTIIQVSYMIFRTGSVLIMGMCTEDILNRIYDFLTSIFRNEYAQFVQPSCE